MKKYEYGFRSVWRREQDDVDKVLNEEVFVYNKPEDVISINVTPVFAPEKTDGLMIPVGFYLNYTYRVEVDA